MKKLYFLLLLIAATVMAAPGLTAQVVTTSPAIVQTNSENIVITFHADQGNKGLMGVTPPTKVYAHTGVITNLSTTDSDWKHAPSWGDNAAKYEMKWVSANTWTLTIPSINSYYGITNPNEIVKKLAFVFRTADNSKEGKGVGNTDIFVNVVEAGFHLTLTTNAENGMVTTSSPVTITASATQAADIDLYINSTSSTPIKSAKGVTSLSADYAFTTNGTYTIIASAKSASGATAVEEVKVTRLSASAAENYPGGTPKMGPVENADGSVTFCLGTLPATKMAVLVGSWNNYEVTADQVMKYQKVGDYLYYWVTVKGLNKNTDNIYYFLLDGTTKVGDPYARLVLDPYNDQWISSAVFPDLPAYPTDKVQNVPLAIYNPSRDNYDWKVKSFRGVAQENLLVYELLIRDFNGTQGTTNGDGTVESVIEKLDYIKELGVNAVELMPIMEFNGNNSWGYNTNFYFAPDKAYGTPADYRRLIDECHQRGMAVILDIVFNQSDGLHPWYQMYPISKNYFYNGSAPHAYSVLNDWNQDNDLVQQQWYDALTYWLDAYKVDGFRFDLVKGLGDNSSYGITYYPATNTFATPSDETTNRYNATRVARMKKLHEAMKKTRPYAYFINENLAGAQEENEMAADGEINWANINYSACQFAMGYNSDASLNRFYAPDDSRTWGSTVSYAESHDEERMAYKQRTSGVNGVKGNTSMSMRRLGSVAAQMILSPGAHMIWQYQEFGADQTTKNAGGGNNTDPKIVVWNYLNHPDRAGLKDNYSDLMGIRGDSPELFARSAATNINLSSWNTMRTITLKTADKELYLFVNPLVDRSLSVTTPVNLADSRYHLATASYGVTPQLSGTNLTLPAGAFAVYTTTNVSGIDEILGDETETVIRVVGRDIVAEGMDASDIEVYTLTGVRVAPTALQTGIYVVRAGNTTAKVVVR